MSLREQFRAAEWCGDPRDRSKLFDNNGFRVAAWGGATVAIAPCRASARKWVCKVLRLFELEDALSSPAERSGPHWSYAVGHIYIQIGNLSSPPERSGPH